MGKNTICVWYDKDAEAAARFYAETFPDSTVGAVHRAPSDFPSGKKGDVLTVEFTVAGVSCIGARLSHGRIGAACGDACPACTFRNDCAGGLSRKPCNRPDGHARQATSACVHRSYRRQPASPLALRSTTNT
jgi:hypothetical protein